MVKRLFIRTVKNILFAIERLFASPMVWKLLSILTKNVFINHSLAMQSSLNILKRLHLYKLVKHQVIWKPVDNYSVC